LTSFLCDIQMSGGFPIGCEQPTFFSWLTGNSVNAGPDILIFFLKWCWMSLRRVGLRFALHSPESLINFDVATTLLLCHDSQSEFLQTPLLWL
jgi:hypothetical protein